MIIIKSKKWFFAVALIFILAPVLAFSSHRDSLYVSKNTNNIQDGSKAHPFKTIAAALKKADGKTDIHVGEGTYEENIEIKKNIKLFGEGKDKTILKSKKDKWSAITVKDDAEINGFSIRNGRRGIWIEKKAEVSIVDCAIKYNDYDGIGIEGSNTKKENQVIIEDSEIRNNGRAGIYSTGARRVVIENNEIIDNKSDGIDLYSGTSAWISKNSIKNNSGSGMKLVIDNSNIWTKNNSIRENKNQGVEVSFYGKSGRINIAKTKFVSNGLFAIAKIQRANFSNNLWGSSLTFDNQNEFISNIKGAISGIIRIF